MYKFQGILYSDLGVFQTVQSDAPGTAEKGDGWARDSQGRGYVIASPQTVGYRYQGRSYTANGALICNTGVGAVAYSYQGYNFDANGAMYLSGLITAALSSVASSTSATDITVTGTTNVDISTGVFGVEYSINSVPGAYAFSLNTTGAAASQSIAINLASEGIAGGDTVYIRAYYNLDPLDDPSTRVYGTPTLTVTIASGFNGLLLGQA